MTLQIIKATPAQIAAGVKRARLALDTYSHFYSSMVPDEALQTVVSQALESALNVPPSPPPKETKA